MSDMNFLKMFNIADISREHPETNYTDSLRELHVKLCDAQWDDFVRHSKVVEILQSTVMLIRDYAYIIENGSCSNDDDIAVQKYLIDIFKACRGWLDSENHGESPHSNEPVEVYQAALNELVDGIATTHTCNKAAMYAMLKALSNGWMYKDILIPGGFMVNESIDQFYKVMGDSITTYFEPGEAMPYFGQTF